jgi:UDP-glucose 4-epimerase
MKFLVTGGAGFIGSNMVDFLINHGHDVIIVDNLTTGKKENLNPSAQFYNIDLYKENINELLVNVDYVIHMAAIPNVQQSIDQPLYTTEHNLSATIRLLNSIRKFSNIKKLVFSSTSAIYGNPLKFPVDESLPSNPLSPYGLQKLCSEQYIKMFTELYGINAVCLRYFNVFGNRMTSEGAYKSVISIFMGQYKKGKPLTITNDGNQRRDFINVNDVVMANYLSCINDTGNFDIFNVGYGENISVNEIANYFNSETTYIGNRIEPKETLCDNTKIKNKLGWSPSVSVGDWLTNKLKNG